MEQNNNQLRKNDGSFFSEEKENVENLKEVENEKSNPGLEEVVTPNQEVPAEEPTEEEPTEEPTEEESAEVPAEEPEEEESAEEPEEEESAEEPAEVPEEEEPAEDESVQEQPESEESEEEQAILRDLSIKEKNIRSKLINKIQNQCQKKESADSPTQYIEKVQLQSVLTDTEEEISNLLKSYSDKLHTFLYFQPVIATESLSIGSITPETIDTCKDEELDVITNPDNSSKIISTKYKKVGRGTESQTLFSFLRTKSKDIKQKNRFFPLLLSSFLQVLDSISKLQSMDTPITHFNLTEQSILYDNINAIPVISDFRIAFTKTDVDNPEKMKDLFPFYDEYSVWPIEIFVISRLLEDTTSENATPEHVFTQEHITKYIADFLAMPFFSDVYESQQKTEFENLANPFFMQMVNKPATEVIDMLKTYMPSWDVYSVAVSFHVFLREFQTLCEKCNFIQTYIHILNKTILSVPSERPSIQSIIEDIEIAFNNISKTEYSDCIDVLLGADTSL